MLAPFSEKGLVLGTLPGPPQATEDSSQRDLDLARTRVAKWPQLEFSYSSRRPHLNLVSPPNCCSHSGNQVINTTAPFTLSLLWNI